MLPTQTTALAVAPKGPARSAMSPEGDETHLVERATRWDLLQAQNAPKAFAIQWMVRSLAERPMAMVFVAGLPTAKVKPLMIFRTPRGTSVAAMVLAATQLEVERAV